MHTESYHLAFLLLAGGRSARYGGNKLLSEHPESNLPLVEHSLRVLLNAKTAHTNMQVTNCEAAVSEVSHKGLFDKTNQVTLVAGKWHESLETQLSHCPVNLVHNTQWEEGIASSIRFGLQHVLSVSCSVSETIAPKSNGNNLRGVHGAEHASRSYSPSHLLISLADLPCLAEQDLANLIQASQNNPDKIVCCEWKAKNSGNETLNGSEARLTVPAIFPKAIFSELLTLEGDTGAKPIIRKYMKKGKVVAIPTPNAQFDIDVPQDWANIAMPRNRPTHED